MFRGHHPPANRRAEAQGATYAEHVGATPVAPALVAGGRAAAAASDSSASQQAAKQAGLGRVPPLRWKCARTPHPEYLHVDVDLDLLDRAQGLEAGFIT